MRTLAIVAFLCCLTLSGCDPTATRGKSQREAIEPKTVGANAAQLAETGSHPPKVKNSLGMELVFIRPGSFLMGGEKTPEEVARLLDGKVEWYNDEHPQHRVTLTRGFYMGTTEVTRGQFAQFVRATGYETDAHKDGWAYTWTDQGWKKEPGACWEKPGLVQDDNHPVVDVSWNDAVAFCRWLSGKEKKHYRLPTEAEWEYACRAGSTTAYPWGEDADGGEGRCNAADLTGKEKFKSWATCKWADGYIFTAPVASFRANAFGLYDMSGNVWERCDDWYGNYPAGAITDPTGPTNGAVRVMRGCSWNYLPKDCRSAKRGWVEPDGNNITVGFRVCQADPVKMSHVAEPPQAPIAAPKGWSVKSRRTRVGTPKGEAAKEIAFYRNSIGQEFVLIPAGEFMMGSRLKPDETVSMFGGESDYYKYEYPRHHVTLSKPFYMAATEITRAQFAQFVRETAYTTSAEKEGWAIAWKEDALARAEGVSWKTPGFAQTDRDPVVCISWNDAVAFCQWLGRKEGRSYRLPTEAQWEYAARADTTTLFPWGDSIGGGEGWVNVMDLTAGEEFPDRITVDWRDGYVFTSPVGSFNANAWGLFDMMGNAWEWCLDWSGNYPDGAVSDPKGPSTTDWRGFRGGSWLRGIVTCRSSYRGYDEPNARSTETGFRVCVDTE